MSDRYFRLLERLQRLDAALRLARHPIDRLRLHRRKSAVKQRLAGLFLRRPEALGH
ncbi:MAG: DUF465 domain-containing protein [Novosphingobium meiothermophilum]|uniref:DUF465 domain-containing protein n=1 Tax=Novosphingobium TaxID=165696 RepID=UPI000D6E62F9|nr:MULTISPECIES: DUF465 domain-containing protein [Novosphingobium]